MLRLTLTDDGWLKELNLYLNMNDEDNYFPFLPPVSVKTQVVAGLDGEIPISSRFEPRVFPIYACTRGTFTREDLIYIKRNVEKYMIAAKTEGLELYIESMRAVITVRLSGEVTTPTHKPNYVVFYFPLTAYDIRFQQAVDRFFRGTYGLLTITNDGSIPIKPIFELSGVLTDPVFKIGSELDPVSSRVINPTIFKYNGTIKDGEVIYVDNYKLEAYTLTANNQKIYRNNEWGTLFYEFPVGTTYIDVMDWTDTDKVKFAIRWKTGTLSYNFK